MNGQEPTTERQALTMERQLSTNKRQGPTTNGQPLTTDRQTSTTDRQPSTTDGQEPTMDGQALKITGQRLTTRGQKLAINPFEANAGSSLCLCGFVATLFFLKFEQGLRKCSGVPCQEEDSFSAALFLLLIIRLHNVPTDE